MKARNLLFFLPSLGVVIVFFLLQFWKQFSTTEITLVLTGWTFSYIGGKFIPRPRHTKTLQFSAVLQIQGLKVMGYVLNMPNVQKKCASPCKLDQNTVYLK